MCFNSGPVMAGTYNIRPWLGLNLGTWTLDPVYDLSGINQLAGLGFQYPGVGYVWDILAPSTSTVIMNDPGNGNVYGVYNEYNSGKIIGVVQPYGGLADTASPGNKSYLMCRYLQMLGFELPCYFLNVAENNKPVSGSLTCSPNPFTNSTTVEYTLDAPGRISITLFSAQGLQFRTLFDGNQTSGTHRLVIDGENFPGGIYFCRLVAGNEVVIGKMLKY
jgi:hypothetical protein